ncbi:hypothetical protein K435DRAFT_280000 [Dendrothele bispora CBS 962.96]|uniref:Uncharacterized protein n=1 Tax=Dendrothele bispora (strain CBS 962.96) TaxID=1314807 RepID=A0A4S8ML19_DENBC|nr:hypothetical protein K435DRAFT_280000 [Dendrothele bispora CBS 962.96]
MKLYCTLSTLHLPSLCLLKTCPLGASLIVHESFLPIPPCLSPPQNTSHQPTQPIYTMYTTMRKLIEQLERLPGKLKNILGQRDPTGSSTSSGGDVPTLITAPTIPDNVADPGLVSHPSVSWKKLMLRTSTNHQRGIQPPQSKLSSLNVVTLLFQVLSHINRTLLGKF